MTEFETRAIKLLEEISDNIASIKAIVATTTKTEAALEKRKLDAMNKTTEAITKKYGIPPRTS
jgi:hypothetical protein